MGVVVSKLPFLRVSVLVVCVRALGCESKNVSDVIDVGAPGEPQEWKCYAPRYRRKV